MGAICEICQKPVVDNGDRCVCTYDITNIQWKGTDLCMDFECPTCEASCHIDGYFATYIMCCHCEAVFKLATSVAVERVKTTPEGWLPLRGAK